MKTIAIETVEVPSTVEEAYRAVRANFAKPGAVLGKESDEASCVYRTRSGAGCAVGCLVPDSLYAHTMERKNLDRVISWAYGDMVDSEAPPSPGLRAFILGLTEDAEVARFLTIAQILHDALSNDARDFVRLLDAAYVSFVVTSTATKVDGGIRRDSDRGWIHTYE